MKKEWVKPELVILDVSKTMLGKTGQHLDADYDEGTGKDELTFS